MRRPSRAVSAALGSTLMGCMGESSAPSVMTCQQRAAGIPPPIRKTPPPPPRGKLPPPPPLPSRAANAAGVQGVMWKSPSEVLAMMVEYVPTYYVPINCVGAIMQEDHRQLFIGKNKLLTFLKKYRFFFEVRLVDGARADVMLRPDVQHPKKGAADEKYELTDIGDVETYTAKAEFVTSLDSLERGSNVSVNVRPVTPPPSVHVRMEENVAVVDRLKALVPVEFAPLNEVEENVPEDVLFHPYFDCQGGLQSICNKLPDQFQLVDGMVRLRRPHLAPMATEEFGFDDSPLPEVMEKVAKDVRATDLAQWVSVTSLYEQLTVSERRKVKQHFRSFAGFLRAHGKCLSISHDTLKVALWTPPRKSVGTSVESDAAASTEKKEGDSTTTTAESPSEGQQPPKPLETTQYTETHIVNELFDRFPPGKSLSGTEIMNLVPEAMKSSMPKNIIYLLQQHPGYFIMDNADTQDIANARVRRAASSVPLDIAQAIYPYIPDDGSLPKDMLMDNLPVKLRSYIERFGFENVISSLSEWLLLDDTDVVKLKSNEELELAIQTATKGRLSVRDGVERKAKDATQAALEEELAEPLKYQGGMARQEGFKRRGGRHTMGDPRHRM